MTASTSALAAIAGKCSGDTSGGHTTIRRTKPSSSTMATAAAIWSCTGSRTERPQSSWASRSRQVLSMRSVSATLAFVPQRRRAEQSVRARSCRMASTGRAKVFIVPNEVAKSYRIKNVLGLGERIQIQRLFQPGHKHCNRKGVEARVQQDKFIRQRRKV